jgi:hypothetical protein
MPAANSFLAALVERAAMGLHADNGTKEDLGSLSVRIRRKRAGRLGLS